MLLLPSLLGGVVTAAPVMAAEEQPVAGPTVSVDPDRQTSLPQFGGMDSALLDMWRDTQAEACLQPGETPTSDQEQQLAQVYEGLEDSPVGQALVSAAEAGDVTMCDDTTGVLQDRFAAYYIFPFQATILDLDNQQHDRNTLVDLAGHEKRHAMQAR
ncbi:MAG: hypothetical protein AAF213_02080, partial [Pseudomonadota bacterium]